jgi:hypothetical protein
MAYLANDWESFIAFAADGMTELSNNRMENHIRPFAIGRKNWLFADSVAGAHASAGLYSLLLSARAHELDLRKYHSMLLATVPKILKSQNPDLNHLLPWNWEDPQAPL